MKTATIGILALLCVWASGCKRPAPTPAASPRIVTFAPHITEIAYELGLGPHLVGVTTFCIVPEGFFLGGSPRPPALGNAFKINSEAILSQAPDILFYNTRESDYAALRRLDPALRLVRVRNDTLEHLREGIRAMGEAVERPESAAALLDRMDSELAAVAAAVAARPRPRVLFVMGTEHPSTVGEGFMMHQLLELAGGRNVAAEAELSRWARINLETVVALRPDVLICLAGEGPDEVAAARAYWAEKTAVKAVRDGRLYVTGDRRLTIQGSRVGWIARTFAEMIHPDAFAEAAGKGAGN